MRVARGLGAKGIGGEPLLVSGAVRAACPECGAGIGERCRSYKVVGGERQYIRGYRRPHRQRVAAWRADPS